MLMVRETPPHAGHLESLLKLARLGAVIAPPVPAFYSKLKSVEDLVDHAVGRVLGLFDLDTDLPHRCARLEGWRHRRVEEVWPKLSYSAHNTGRQPRTTLAQTVLQSLTSPPTLCGAVIRRGGASAVRTEVIATPLQDTPLSPWDRRACRGMRGGHPLVLIARAPRVA